MTRTAVSRPAGKGMHENGPARGESLRIGEMSLVTGCSERALRYYEEIGLLRPAGHSAGGSRRYGPAEVTRVRRIRELQDLMGFNLDEIRAILVNEDRLDSLRCAWLAGGETADRHEILAEAISLLDELRAKVDAKLERLRAFGGELEEKALVARSLAADEAAPVDDRGAAAQLGVMP